ncbi:MAG TPA: hypothetical protein VFO42_05240 [Sphingomicrobium sp.]|nr:hypothetical protein [Sphingomicrobium sp.]
MVKLVSVEGAGVPLKLDGGSSPRRRAVSKQDISDEQLDIFFDTLANTCNVTRSAKAAGFRPITAYRKRREDASFRARWGQAVREGYAKLELVLLERAMCGTEKTVRARSGDDSVIREYSNALAIALLRRHAEMRDIEELVVRAGHDSARRRSSRRHGDGNSLRTRQRGRAAKCRAHRAG